MKSFSSLLTVSLMLATGTVLAQEPVKDTAPPDATPHAMDHSKMDMSDMKSADHQKMAAEKFIELDANKDGSLSKDEFAKLHAMMGKHHGPMDHSKMDMSGTKSADHQKMASAQFAKLDSNKDGSLSNDEFARLHAMMSKQHGHMDHSKMEMSGMSAADHQKMAMAKFAEIDSNNDGSLSKDEFAKHHAMMGMGHGQRDHHKMEHSRKDMQHGKMDHSKMEMSGTKSADHQKMAAEAFAKLDKDKDGKLSKAEIPAQHPLAAHFGMIDTNKDGSLSKAEFTKHHGM